VVFTLIAILIGVSILATTIWSFTSASARAKSFRRRLPTLYGAIGALGSLLLPWVNFSLLNDIQVVSPPVLDALLTALELLADLLNLTPLRIVAWLVERTTSLPGYMLFIAMPRFHKLVVWAVAAPAIAGLLSLIAGLIAFLSMGRLAGRIAGGFQLAVSGAGLGLLLAEMPRLDQWGTTGDFKMGLMAVSIGAGLDLGAWVAVVSLALMVVGALITLFEPAHSPSTMDYGYGTPSSGYPTIPPWS